MPPSVSNTIHVTATRAQVVRILNDLPRLLNGSPGGAGGFVRALQVRVGLSILERIKDAFLVKAAGGTDAAGDSWKPLSPHTIAYGRKHPGVPKKRPFWTTHPSYSLTAKRRDRWWQLYYGFKAKFRGNKRRAAATAWVILRREQPGIRTLMDRFGNTPVEILRDTGLLLNSLSPGVPADDAPMSPPRKPSQVFRCTPGSVIIGTNRKGAAKHHEGDPPRFPQRRLWPEPSRWPAEWWSDAVGQLRQGVLAVILYILKGRP